MKAPSHNVYLCPGTKDQPFRKTNQTDEMRKVTARLRKMALNQPECRPATFSIIDAGTAKRRVNKRKLKLKSRKFFKQKSKRGLKRGRKKDRRNHSNKKKKKSSRKREKML